MRQRIIGIAGVVIAIGGLFLSTTAGADTPRPPARAHWMKVLCPNETATDCAWNAGSQGNGRGHSFYAVTRPLRSAHGDRIGDVDCVFYVKFADRKWDSCRATGTTVNANPQPWWMTRECTGNHAVNCRWLAKRHPRWAPRNFYVRYIPGGDRTCVYYAGTRRFANRHDYCA